MKCLLCFLEDDFHADLRAEAQTSSRHERVLKVYRDRFIEEFNRLGSANDCPSHRDTPEQFRWWIDRLLAKIQTLDASGILGRLIAIYEAWISGHLSQAGEVLDRLLKDFGLDNRPTKKLDKVLLFRGRKGNLTKYDLLHIPFDKRHCISNQRYSLSGQPLLYLGLSILDVVCELRGDPTAIADFSFSYFWLRDPNKIRVLDTSNELRHTILNNLLAIINGGANVRAASAENPTFSPDHQTYSDAFVTFVVASLCSFKRKEVTANDKFAPEYVLPQLMAAWARVNGYDGILYSSTRIDPERWRMQGSLKLNRYRENVAFFTNFDPASDDEHDSGLLDRFEISEPVRLSGAAAISDGDLLALRKRIVTSGNAPSLTQLAQVSGIDIDVAFNDLVLIEPPGRIVPYPQTDCGKLQRHLQFEFMKRRAT